jgi:glucans biosynthesis protein
VIPILLGSGLGAGFLGCPSGPAAQEKPTEGFGFAAVKKQAEVRAQRPFQKPEPLPEALRRLTYDQYRLIAIRHERALWREPSFPFRVELFHRGFMATDKPDIFLVEDGRERRLAFDPGLFQYRGELASLKVSDDWGYAGFRLLCRLPTWTHYQEFCTFLGASYFRAICNNQVYGISARGLAIDTGLPHPEEFPAFRTFWIERPAPHSKNIRVWALLDGPSVTGAYQFLITPGLEQTTLAIDCQVFVRQRVEKLGLAPMSSMWAWGAGGRPASDPRPQVHDSDGLLVAGDNGEWLWRPLARRDHATVSRFEVKDLKGFGLLQRDRDPEHYRDNEAKYHLRPNLWIRPRHAWGPGAVELLELPTDTETADNIAAYWVPKESLRRGETRTLAYEAAFAVGEPKEHAGGRFVTTDCERLEGGDLRFRLVVESSARRSLAPDAVLEPVVTTGRGRVTETACSRLPGGAWELRFRLAREKDVPSELRAFVRQGRNILTETWSYLCK